jgi:hypothetical protein
MSLMEGRGKTNEAVGYKMSLLVRAIVVVQWFRIYKSDKSASYSFLIKKYQSVKLLSLISLCIYPKNSSGVFSFLKSSPA